MKCPNVMCMHVFIYVLMPYIRKTSEATEIMFITYLFFYFPVSLQKNFFRMIFFKCNIPN